jgi:hypothetical protein
MTGRQRPNATGYSVFVILGQGEAMRSAQLETTPLKTRHGPEGVLARLAPGSAYLDMSTVSRTLAGRVPSYGAAILVAPVPGSLAAVEDGSLAIIVGGQTDAFARVEPILHQLGQTVTWFRNFLAGIRWVPRHQPKDWTVKPSTTSPIETTKRGTS